MTASATASRERGLARHWDLFWMLSRTEFSLRDQGTAMGFLWTLLHPLLHFLILYALFVQWMGSRIEHYGAFLLIGIVQWNFFASGTTHGLTSLRRKAGLIANFAFPRVLVVASSVAAVFFSYLLEWGLLLVLLPAFGVRPSPAWLLLPGVLAFQLALVLGAACLLSVLAVEFRDLDNVWGLFLYAVFFLTPVFYTPEAVGPAGRRLVEWNPLAMVLQATRGLLLDGRVPAGGAAPAAAAAAACAAVLAAGLWLFPRMSRGVCEKL